MAAGDLFKKAAAYRKKHKGMTMPEAVKAIAKGKVSGTKKKRKKTAIAAAPKKRKAAAPKRIAGTRKRTTAKRVGSTRVNPVKGIGVRAMESAARIARLETRYKNAPKEQKLVLALIINQEHDKLDRLKKLLKK